jgi:histone deacetylase 6
MDNTETDTAMGGMETTVLQSLETNGITESTSRLPLPLGLAQIHQTVDDSGSDEGLPRTSGLSLPASNQNGRARDSSSLTSVSSTTFLTSTSRFVGVVIPKPASMALPYASSRTGVVYDARMRFHTEKDTEEEDDIHPEDPRRIYEIFKALQDADLLENEGDREATEAAAVPFKLWRIAARFAEPGEIALVHSQDHYRFMETLTRRS